MNKPDYIRKTKTIIIDIDIVFTDGTYFRITDEDLLWNLSEEELDLNISFQYFMNKGGLQ